MKKIAVIFLVGVVVLMSGSAGLCQQDPKTVPEVVWEPIAGGEFRIQDNVMVARVNVPLMAERLKAYGQLVQEKDGSRKVVETYKALVTPAGNKLYQRLMMITTEGGVFMIFNVAMRHATVTIVIDTRHGWDEVLPEIHKIFSEVFESK